MTASPPSIAPATSPAGCVEGKGARDKDGYVKAFCQGKHTRAHRVAYCQAHGLSLEDIEGQLVLHSCDNPPCVNPAHLSDGTPADNTREMIERGRQSRGEDHANAKLSDDEVREIRRRYATGSVSQEALGVEYGVSGVHIGNIVRGRQRV